MLLREEQHTMDVLPSILDVSWVHGRGPTSLGTNQYNGILFIQISEHLSCGTRFGENYKTTMPSLGWFMLLYEEPHAMDMSPPIQHFLIIEVPLLPNDAFHFHQVERCVKPPTFLANIPSLATETQKLGGNSQY